MDNLTQSSVNRYGEEDLMIFKELLEKKLKKAEDEKSFLLEQIQSITENEDGDVDWMDDTSTSSDLEMLYAQASRLSQNIRDINNALVRVHNKSYGICMVTGNLIDKRRLLAVPTTTKSLEAKNMLAADAEAAERKSAAPARTTTPSTERKIISKIISKPAPKAPVPTELDDDEDEDDDDFLDDDLDLDFDVVDETETDDLED
jgi:RNA polymerase-binding transcription factor DksA